MRNRREPSCRTVPTSFYRRSIFCKPATANVLPSHHPNRSSKGIRFHRTETVPIRRLRCLRLRLPPNTDPSSRRSQSFARPKSSIFFSAPGLSIRPQAEAYSRACRRSLSEAQKDAGSSMPRSLCQDFRTPSRQAQRCSRRPNCARCAERSCRL